MVVFLFIWMLCCLGVQNVEVITYLFHVSAQRGDIPDRTVECAATCSQEVTCVGFDVSANECTLLQLPNAEPQDGHTLYLSQDRVEANVPECAPTAARVSSSGFYAYFSAKDDIYKYSTDNMEDMTGGRLMAQDTFTSSYHDLDPLTRMPNAGFRYRGDLFFLIGTNIEVQEWNSDVDSYKVFTPHYPRSLRVEMGDVPIPSSVNAADINDTTLYLLQGNTVYSYSMDGYPPDVVYVFLGQFDMRENSGLNPFSAGPGSPLAHPPSWITAMVFADDDRVLIAFSYKDIYLYSDGEWEYIGVLFTPCD